MKCPVCRKKIIKEQDTCFIEDEHAFYSPPIDRLYDYVVYIKNKENGLKIYIRSDHGKFTIETGVNHGESSAIDWGHFYTDAISRPPRSYAYAIRL
jgi:hypothetical protein